jgi:hypothetical protein
MTKGVSASQQEFCSMKLVGSLVDSPHYIASQRPWIKDWLGYETKWSWPNLRYYARICVEEQGKTTERRVTTVDVPAEIRTRHFRNSLTGTSHTQNWICDESEHKPKIRWAQELLRLHNDFKLGLLTPIRNANTVPPCSRRLVSGQTNGQTDEWTWWIAGWFVGWTDVLMEGRQTQESANGLTGQNVIVVLNSERTVGWRNTCDKSQITRSCSCWPERVTTRHARTQKRPVLRYSLRDGFPPSTITAALCRTPQGLYGITTEFGTADRPGQDSYFLYLTRRPQISTARWSA